MPGGEDKAANLALGITAALAASKGGRVDRRVSVLANRRHAVSKGFEAPDEREHNTGQSEATLDALSILSTRRDILAFRLSPCFGVKPPTDFLAGVISRANEGRRLWEPRYSVAQVPRRPIQPNE
jgi:hypothetical protein